MNLNTKEPVEAQFEVNLPTEKIKGYLEDVFGGWSILKTAVSKQEYDIPRDKIVSHLRTDVVTYVVRKCN